MYQARKLLCGLAAILLASSAIARSAGMGPIIIGVSTPLTGNAAYLGQHEKHGAELAVEQINAAGGVLGRQLALHVEDNRCNPSEGVSSATRLLDNKDLIALIGAMCSSVTLAVMPVAERVKVPFVVNISTARNIAEKAGVGGNEWTFQTNPSDDGLADALARYLGQQGTFRNIALVGEDTDYGRGGAEMLGDALKEKNISIVSTDFFQQGTQDFTTLLTRLNAKKPDAIALYALAADQLNFFRQYQGFGLTIPLTGRVELSGLQQKVINSGILDRATSVFPYSPSVDTPENQSFVKAFKDKHQEEPIYQSFAGYEAIQLVGDALRRAGTADRGAVREALKSADYPSMMGGKIAFDDHNHAHNNAAVLQVKGDEVVVLGLYGT